MNFVEPIRDRKKIAQTRNQLRGQRRFRDLLLFTMGTNSALRVSDLPQLQIGQLLDDQTGYRRRFWIHEQKRNKRHEVVINQSIREALEEYLAAYPGTADNPENFVFFNTKKNAYSEPIKRGQAWKFIVSICFDVGLSGNYGTHSLRKTWGYHARMQGVDLALIMHKLNHESVAYTKRYLGITDDELQAVAQRSNLQRLPSPMIDIALVFDYALVTQGQDPRPWFISHFGSFPPPQILLNVTLLTLSRQ